MKEMARDVTRCLIISGSAPRNNDGGKGGVAMKNGRSDYSTGRDGSESEGTSKKYQKSEYLQGRG